METPESIATDVAHELSQNTAMQTLGPLAELGLNNYHLYFPPGHHHTPHNKEIILVLQHILSATAYEKDTTTLLVESLEVLSQAPTGANAGEIPQTCLMVSQLEVSPLISGSFEGRRLTPFSILLCVISSDFQGTSVHSRLETAATHCIDYVEYT
jgi:hypothetical protein